MLILKFIEEKKRRRLFRRKETPFKTNGFICSNTVFNVVELHKCNMKNDEVVTLLNKYKGYILETSDTNINKSISDYLFDCTPYIKRAYLSGLCLFLSTRNQPCLKVYDNSFRFSSEWINVASLCKRIILVGAENNDMYLFQDYCLNELGLNVFLNDDILSSDFYTINLNYINKTESVFVQGKDNNRILLDSKYFIHNDSAEKLIAYGVPPDVACAAVQVIPFKKGYIKTV